MATGSLVRVFSYLTAGGFVLWMVTVVVVVVVAAPTVVVVASH